MWCYTQCKIKSWKPWLNVLDSYLHSYLQQQQKRQTTSEFLQAFWFAVVHYEESVNKLSAPGNHSIWLFFSFKMSSFHLMVAIKRTNDMELRQPRPSVLQSEQPQPWQQHAHIIPTYISTPHKLQPVGWYQYNK